VPEKTKWVNEFREAIEASKKQQPSEDEDDEYEFDELSMAQLP
jgi:hypothetical protein